VDDANIAWSKVSFFAHSIADGATATGVAGGNPVIAFTTQATAAAQVDLVADAVLDKTGADGGTVKFAFAHILSKIGFTVKLDADYAPATVEIKSLRVYYAAGKVSSTGTYTFNSTDNLAAGNWAQAGAATFEEEDPEDGDPVYSTETELTTTALNLSAPDNYLMLIPQELATGDMYVELEYEVTDDVTETFTPVIELPAVNGGWKPGKAYTYNIVLKPNVELEEVGMGFDADIDEGSWDNGVQPGLEVSDSNLGFEADGEQKSFNITSITTWTVVSSEPSWLTVSPGNGSNNGTVDVTAQANSGAARSATITVSGIDVAPKEIGVTQAAAIGSGGAPFEKVEWDFSTITATGTATSMDATTGSGTLTTTAGTTTGTFSKATSPKSIWTGGWVEEEEEEEEEEGVSKIKAWNMEIPVSGFTGGTLKLSFGAYGTDAGPKDFAVEWSANGATWSTPTDEQKYVLTKTTSTTYQKSIQPTGITDKLYIRLRVLPGSKSIGDGNITASGGNSRLTAKLTIEEEE
jgi:hypothetical protein